MLGADVLVLQPLGFLFGGLQDLTKPSGEADLRSAVRARQAVQLRPNSRGKRHRIRVHLPDDFRNDAFFLLEERQQQMLGQYFRVPLAFGKLLRRRGSLPALSPCIY